MGSVVRVSTMPEKLRKTLLNAFSKLKQRVLWKWETEAMPDLAPNVKLGKWLPQQDILGHLKLRLFITHGDGGLLEYRRGCLPHRATWWYSSSWRSRLETETC